MESPLSFSHVLTGRVPECSLKMDVLVPASATILLTSFKTCCPGPAQHKEGSAWRYREHTIAHSLIQSFFKEPHLNTQLKNEITKIYMRQPLPLNIQEWHPTSVDVETINSGNQLATLILQTVRKKGSLMSRKYMNRLTT